MTKIAKPAETGPRTKIKHFDVVIVGAGISGVGGAYHLTKQCPGTSFIVLEAQESFGGTWLTHRYPGIRSVRQRSLHLWLPLQAVDERPDRDGTRDPDRAGHSGRRADAHSS